MLKYSFFNDYSEGAHPAVLEAINECNFSQDAGYGEDTVSLETAAVIRKWTGNPDASVHFVTGGTQANIIVLASLMKPYEAVVSALNAHINVHEAGAVEACGHKILCIESSDGKISPEGVREVMRDHTDEHKVRPKVIAISQTTELGCVYRKKELEELSSCCRELGLYIFMDGARLAQALTAESSDCSITDIASLTDIFTFGGTKNGALLGEAIIINNRNLNEGFRFHVKQRGAMLAKGRVLSAQFNALLKNELWKELALHANKAAGSLAAGLKSAGVSFLVEAESNQIFPIFPNEVIENLRELYGFYIWAPVDSRKSAVRLVTSWFTPDSAVESFLDDVRRFLRKDA